VNGPTLLHVRYQDHDEQHQQEDDLIRREAGKGQGALKAMVGHGAPVLNKGWANISM
jgi:hypothetical protein